MNILLGVNIAALLAGGIWLWASFVLMMVLTSPADELAGDTRSGVINAPERLLLGMLYLTLPLLAFNVVLFIHYFGSGDPLFLIELLGKMGVDVSALRSGTSSFERIGGFLALGLLTGAAGTNVAHELIHRTGSPVALLIGRWLLAFSLDTTFSIEHVHGHHRHVATDQDPATARRGETVFGFAARSLVQGNISAFKIESDRLRRKGRGVLSVDNRAITGQFMSLALIVLCGIIGGWTGVAAFLACAVQGKFYLEVVNYIEHYGLVRVPGARVEARHSWNCYRTISNAVLYNLPRHSHHHSYAAKPFWTLEVEEDGPVLPFGYMTMIGLALIPPLYWRCMQPLLDGWDRTQATEAERDILTRARMLA